MYFFIFFLLFSNFENTVSINFLFDLARENSPYLISLKKEIEARELEILPSSQLPNPMIETMYQNVGLDKFSYGKEEMSMLQFKVEQNLLYPKKRKAMEEISKENFHISQDYYKIALSEVKKRIREIYADIYSLNKEKEGIKAGIELLNSIKLALSGSISSGEKGQESFLKIEIMRQKLDLRLKEIEKNIFLYIEELKRITGYSLNLNNLEISSIPDINILENYSEESINNSPVLKYYESIFKLKEKELLKKKLNLKPDIIGFSSIGFRGNMDPVFSIGGAVEFPFWKNKKEKPLILSGEKEVEASKNILEDTKLKIKEEVNGALESINKLQESIKIYNEGYLKVSSYAIEAAISIFISGKGDFSTVVEDINLWIEGKTEVSKLEAEKFKAVSRILFHIEE